MAEKYEQIRLKSSYELVTTKEELCKDQPQKKTSSRKSRWFFSNRNVRQTLFKKNGKMPSRFCNATDSSCSSLNGANKRVKGF